MFQRIKSITLKGIFSRDAGAGKDGTDAPQEEKEDMTDGKQREVAAAGRGKEVEIQAGEAEAGVSGETTTRTYTGTVEMPDADNGPEKLELTVTATLENYDLVAEFIEGGLEEHEVPMGAQAQIVIALDEIYTNVVKYGYGEEKGDFTVQIEFMSDVTGVNVTFIDSGAPYDPLKRTDPDVTLTAEEREIGGLGIYMVKKMMDDIRYEFKNGQNILWISKVF